MDWSALGGLWNPCAGSRTPWGSHIGGEEYEPDARPFSEATDLASFKAQMDASSGYGEVEGYMAYWVSTASWQAGWGAGGPAGKQDWRRQALVTGRALPGGWAGRGRAPLACHRGVSGRNLPQAAAVWPRRSARQCPTLSAHPLPHHRMCTRLTSPST